MRHTVYSMNPFYTSVYRGIDQATLIKELEDACRALNVTRGRAKKYLALLRSFYDQENRSEEHLLAHFEAIDLVSLFKLWEKYISSCDRLKERLQKIFESGVHLSSHELGGRNTDKSRSDSFNFWLAGRMLAGGIDVRSIDRISVQDVVNSKQVATGHSSADIAFRWERTPMAVECKRVRSLNQLEKRVKEAISQINKLRGRCGVIALDCPSLYQRSGHVIERDHSETSDGRALDTLEHDVWYTRVESVAFSSKKILGVILCCDYPAFTNFRDQEFRRDHQKSGVVIPRNGNSTSIRLMLEIQCALNDLIPD